MTATPSPFTGPAGPVAWIADPHLVTRGRNDDACAAGIRWALRTSLGIPGLKAFGVLGDFGDGWLAPWHEILLAYARLLREIDGRLAERGLAFLVTCGNHDSVSAEDLHRLLRLEMPRCGLFVYDGAVMVNGRRCSHGHEWDAWNRSGPLQVVAAIATAIAGGLEWVTGIEESWINPTRLTSPGRMKTVARQMIEEAADRWVQAEDARLRALGVVDVLTQVLHGHTHRRRISSDRRVVCAGSCTHGRGEMAVIWPDGMPVLCEMTGG